MLLPQPAQRASIATQCCSPVGPRYLRDGFLRGGYNWDIGTLNFFYGLGTTQGCKDLRFNILVVKTLSTKVPILDLHLGDLGLGWDGLDLKIVKNVK